MKILVVDDQLRQREHAVKSFPTHEVIVVEKWKEGRDLIRQGGWDIILTDLSMPAERDGQVGTGMNYIGKPMPYGFVLALIALKENIPKIAIVSNGYDDANNHSHPIFYAVDSAGGMIIPGRLWIFTGYDCPHMEAMPGIKNPKEIKNWAAVVKEIMSFDQK